MTSKWRNNKEPFNNRNTPKSGVENFANIPLFDILKNEQKPDETDGKPRERIIEGMDFNNMTNGTNAFNMFLDDYFIGCKRYVRSLRMAGIGGVIKKTFAGLLVNPLYELDKAFDEFLYGLFNIFLQLETSPCTNDDKKKERTETKPSGFTWTNVTQEEGEEDFVTTYEKEGFVTNISEENLKKTLVYFQKNHSWITYDNIDLVSDYYIEQINKYETKIQHHMTPEELLHFNNKFDDKLNDINIQSRILKREKPIATQSPVDTTDMLLIQDANANWESFIRRKARFFINNKRPISYFPFDDNCFPIPKDMNQFNDIIKNHKNEEYTVNFTEYKSKFNDLTDIDLSNNTFSMFTVVRNIHKKEIVTKTMQEYITNTAKHLTYLYIESNSNDSKMRGNPIVYTAMIATLYVKILNYIEYHLDRIFRGKRLNACELAVINAAFYGFFLQNTVDIGGKTKNTKDYMSKNVNVFVEYILQTLVDIIPTGKTGLNISLDNALQEHCNIRTETVSKKYLMEIVLKNYVGKNPNDTISIGDQLTNFGKIITNTADSFKTTASKTVSDANAGILQASKINSEKGLDNFMDGIVNYAASGNNSSNTGNNDKAGPFTTNPYSNNKFYVPIETYLAKKIEPIEPKIDNHFLPKELSECEKKMRETRAEYKRYISIVKFELYRIMVIPICIFVAYNFYYTLFFKDCATPTKIFDDEGNITYKNECDECFNPIFPDLEGYYKYYDSKGRTEYLFEFLFKPVKFLYTLMNAFKALFRKNINLLDTNYIPKDQAPYLFFIGTVCCVYLFVWYNFSKITGYIRKVINMDMPMPGLTSPIEKDPILSGFKATAISIVTISFFFSAVKKICGPNWDLLAVFKSNFIDQTQETSDENPEMSWYEWISNSSTMLFMLLKSIFALFYWGIKYYITIALVPVSLVICFFYILWNILFGLYSNSSQEISISDKIELMNRVMYSKLYIDSKERKFTFTSVFKYVCLVVMFYMFEITSFIILIVGLTNFLEKIKSTELKTFLLILYITLIGLLGLWSVRKFLKKWPEMNAEYVDPRPSPDDGVNKRIEIVKNSDIANNIDKICKDNYELQTENRFISIFLNSDHVNHKIIHDYMNKKKDTPKVDKLNSLAKYVMKKSDKMQNFVSAKLMTLNNMVSNTSGSGSNMFEKVKQMGSSAQDILKNTFTNYGMNPNNFESHKNMA